LVEISAKLSKNLKKPTRHQPVPPQELRLQWRDLLIIPKNRSGL
jgi:hypothetical protein